jgi:DNA-binding CsgD family transcriptional regulator
LRTEAGEEMAREKDRELMFAPQLAGSSPCEHRGAQFPMDTAAWVAIGDTLHLTERELQIVRAMFDGRREDDIARALGISRYTVHTHFGRLYRKLQVDSCSGLLLRVFRVYLEQRESVASPRSCNAANPRLASAH